jgi:LmbE family N-acetylglucosaminyl deacetylase
MQWIYLSPHFDDVALSCGGLVWEQAQAGDAPVVWTICAGQPPAGSLSAFAESLHARWQTGEQAAILRRAEDQAANNRLGAKGRYFSAPDCIYRRGQAGQHLYASEQALFGELHPDEYALVEALVVEFEQAAGSGALNVVAPLGRGGHVDHRLVNAAAVAWQARRSELRLWYYADYPYVRLEPRLAVELEQSGLLPQVFAVSEMGLQAWIEAVGAHASQISSFWASPQAMRADIRDYCIEMGGVRWWREQP